MLRIQWILLFLYVMLPISVCGMAPVHPDAPDYEILQEYHSRRRHGVQPELLHPRVCQGLSDEICLQLDYEMKSNARNLQNIVETGGFLRVLVLLIKFTDHVDRETPPWENYDILFNDSGETPSITPTRSVAAFLDVNSYGKLQIEAEVIPWRLTDNTEEYYSFNQSGLSTEFIRCMYPILDELEAEGFNFSRFDLNQDGVIDSIVVLHSGYAAEIGGEDCYTNATTTNRIWSHTLATSTEQWISSDTSISSNGYAVAAAMRGACDNRTSRIGVITHEFLHTFGLPDLNDSSGDWIGKGLGNFDIMSNPFGVNTGQLHPPHLSPWCKAQLNWTYPFEITQNGDYDVVASELQDNIYLIKSPYPDGEYIYIENRQPILWDELLWTGGIIIWHIDDLKPKERDRGYPGQDGWPGNNNHYMIAVEAADRKYDLETGANNGDGGDFWIQGMVYGSGPIDLVAQNYSMYPNSNSYQNGTIFQTGLSIEILTASQETMRIRVTGFSPTQTVNPTSEPSPEPTLNPTYSPTNQQTTEPTSSGPTRKPSHSTIPSSVPSGQELPTYKPTSSPVVAPAISPTTKPITATPTISGNVFGKPNSSVPSPSASPEAPVPFSPLTAAPVGHNVSHPTIAVNNNTGIEGIGDDQNASTTQGTGSITSAGDRWTWSRFAGVFISIFVSCMF